MKRVATSVALATSVGKEKKEMISFPCLSKAGQEVMSSKEDASEEMEKYLLL